MIYSDESAKSQLLPEKLVHPPEVCYYGKFKWCIVIFVSVVKMDEEKIPVVKTM